MKVSFISAVLLISVFVKTVFSHEFTTCSDNDHLHLSSVDFSNEEVRPGTDLKVSIKGRPDITVSNEATAKVEIRIHGVRLYSETVRLCEEFEVNCPLNSGKDFNAVMTYSVPLATPSVDLHMSVKVSDNGQDVGCFETEVKVVRVQVVRSSKSSNKVSKISNHYFRHLFKLWLKEHQVHIDDFEKRLAIFTQNFLDVMSHNSGDHTYTKAINAFGHLTPQEFSETHLGYNQAAGYRKSVFSDIIGSGNSVVKTAFLSRSLKDLPDSVDWVSKGAVTKISSQGRCGSCWAFSAICSLESAFFIKTGKLVKFSEQQLVSCDKDCFACNGGIMDSGFQFDEDHKGICSDEDYPYTSDGGMVDSCRECTVVPGSAVKSIVDVTSNDEIALMTAVAQQPVSIAINANNIQFYKSGILTSNCPQSPLNHGVVAVGYGTSKDGIDFWKIRNSWGVEFGEEGYFRIQRGKNGPFPWNKSGLCGILSQPSYPVLK